MKDFYCENCRDWTKSDPDTDTARCGKCGVEYGCGECGFDIDREGNCQREHVTGDKCPSTEGDQ